LNVIDDPRHRFFLVLRDEDGAVRREELDFNALVQDVAFSAVCGGRLPNDGRWGPVSVEPEWEGTRVSAVRVAVAGCSRRYGRPVFRDRAVEVLHAPQGKERREMEMSSSVSSWDVEVGSPATAEGLPAARASVRHRPFPFAAGAGGIASPDFERQAACASVVISARLIEELCEASAGSLDCERADFLTGHLVQSTDGRIIVALERRIPVRMEDGSSAAHFAFSPQSFHAVRQELTGRRDGQVIVGWHHNHPPPCGSTCLQLVPPCQSDSVFFSVDDRIVHRSAFPQPYMVALVSGKGAGCRADRPLIRAFGWRRGRIRMRPMAVFSAG
jgi:proteasome lid subunit RPN8/RPN11